MNLLAAEPTDAGVQVKGFAPAPLAAPAGARGLSLGVRPEDLRLAEDGEAAFYEGDASLVEKLGESVNTSERI